MVVQFLSQSRSYFLVAVDKLELGQMFFIVSSSNVTNKMQHYTIFFIFVISLHVSSGFSASLVESERLTQARGHSIQV